MSEYDFLGDEPNEREPIEDEDLFEEESEELISTRTESHMRRELLTGIDKALADGCVVQFESDVTSGRVLIKVIHRYGDNPARSMSFLMPPHEYDKRTPEIWMGHTLEFASDVLTGKFPRRDDHPPINVEQ